jgi:hypothetical protein
MSAHKTTRLAGLASRDDIPASTHAAAKQHFVARALGHAIATCCFR